MDLKKQAAAAKKNKKTHPEKETAKVNENDNV
jgi:hypothetical protein